ncbi:MAG: hypothetical protein A2667_02585 [Candidatus Wildermuthbacteria bacterium RIFCSPHIGHO2_01_FULL_47_27]|uniref:Response regulatory domain-containing protein n=2 Tax=Candidatus Wildermuthiibacteriota TaxID=1817923 RepID=A0A1G2RMS8_9BACT|nr:MAG: Response regulator receiver protein [Parcubacteria group bacterium GW2011_GWA2_47_9]OHA63614.1 MAG: hypothetical protein A2667_02585 [Candidatus Wildermuthbacteria bacterium RIFCSPHIGHO2_01_FULL_47_27]OHA68292.1 MAG: hypothetical protein A3D59_03990 [Candidatus Wildermuthbacteria bacterium RIFCSPHIGHO2_02_FULL_47_17]OHA74150.1 MAG: hypothetical protein A3A32_00455 [Candidatus Wildermuthbacteria bacterium RIFCSPLOWO2_01_FULL_48_35]OHA75996.1 MAG: hypothetical protein A3I38_03125 [Candida
MAKKILIIEDEKILRELLSAKLLREGYDVETAKDGAEGLRVTQEVRPDLVLLDIFMPKLSGFEVLEILRNDVQLRNIPVIVISNSGQPSELEQAKDLGAIDVLIKTAFDPQEVIDKIARQIGR